jgi:uncharacterized caspase-like protein
MWRSAAVFALCFSTAFAHFDAALAEKRVALVIGNSAYVHAPPLVNPVNDAEDMAATLKALGFQVTTGTDLDKPALDRTVSEFASALKGANLALFFYAGHGLQVAGQNYLIPVDAKLESSSALDFEAVRLDLIQRTMERETNTNVLFLDACRDSPLARNLARSMGTRSTDIGRGLAVQESGTGTLISFSTQPGNVALDGTGRNSPFAAALTKHLQTPGEDLSAILIKVRNDVMEATANRQVPWEHSALRARLYFSPSGPTAAPPVGSTLPATKNTMKVRVLDNKLVTLMDGTLRFKADSAVAGGGCTVFYDTGPTGRFNDPFFLGTDEWTTKKLVNGTYKIMLVEADGESCTFDFTAE